MTGTSATVASAEVAMIEEVAHAAQEGFEPVEDRKALARRLDDQRVHAGPLAVRDQECGLAGGAMADAQVVDVAGVDAAARDAVVHDRAERRLRVAHEHGQAVLHGDVEVRPARAPGVERVDRRQARVEQGLEVPGGGRRELRQRHAVVGGQVDQELALAAGVVDRHQAAVAEPVRLREHDEARGELVHVARAVHAVAVEDRVVDRVLARDRTRVRDGQLRRELGAPDLQRDDRDAARARALERAHEARGIARRFHEQAHRARARHLERVVEVLVHRDRELLAGRDDQVEVDAFLAVDDAAHARARMADVGDVAAAGVHARTEAAAPDAVGEVVEAHAVRAADDEAGLADLREQPLAQRRIGVALDHQRGHHRRRSRAVRDYVVECGVHARVGDGEYHVFDRFGQRRERRIAGHAEHRLAAGVDGIEAALVAALQQVFERVAPDRALALAGAEDGDRLRPQQGIEPMSHAGACPAVRNPRRASCACAADPRTAAPSRGSGP